MLRNIFTIVSLIASTQIYIAASNFDTVLNTVLANNPSIKIDDSERQIEISDLRSENLLPAPEISFENLWGGGHVGDKRNFSVSQSFDWPGIYKARKEAIKRTETAYNFLRETDILEVRMSIRLLLIDIIYTQQKIKSTKEICQGLRTLSETFKKAMEEGNETRLDYNKSVIERIAAERSLKELEGELNILISSLTTMNGGNDVTALIEELGDEYPAVELSTLKPDIEEIRLKDPSQEALRASILAQESLVKVSKRSLLPGFAVGYLHEWEMGDVFNGFSVSMTLPFFNGKKKTEASKIKLQSLQLQENTELHKIFDMMMGEYANAMALKELIDEYREVACNRSNIELLKKALDGGQINFLTYMQEVNFFLTAHSDFHEALYKYNVSLAKLQRYN